MTAGRRRRRSQHYAVSTLQLLALLLACLSLIQAQQQQDPREMNGGSVLAMAGDECVALAMDKRFGSGPQMVNIAPRHALIPHANLMVAFTGLEGDVQSLSQELSVQVESKLGKALGFMGNRKNKPLISPHAMSTLTSHVLYSQRGRAPYFVEPIIAGLERVRQKDNAEEKEKGGGVSEASKCKICYRPFLCAQDVIGAQSRSEAFVCAGLASKSMYGTAEALWRPGLKSDELAQVCGKAFLSALERDCFSGYGAIVYLMTRDGIVQYDLACRND